MTNDVKSQLFGGLKNVESEEHRIAIRKYLQSNLKQKGSHNPQKQKRNHGRNNCRWNVVPEDSVQDDYDTPEIDAELANALGFT